MKTFKIILIFAALTIFILACAGNKPSDTEALTGAVPPPPEASPLKTVPAPATPTEVDLAETGKLFKTTCVKCHEHLDGGKHKMDGKIYTLPNFLSERMKNKPDQEYIDSITHGIPDEGMPAFKDKLSEAQIKSLVAYIRKEIQKQ